MMDTPPPLDPNLACPYPGLRPFTSDEADLFFGRASQIGDMLARLETRRFLAVVGVSGCGKSSLVRAGLIPAVRDGWLASQATDWRIAILRPGSDPFAALTAALLDPEALGPERAGPTNAAGFLESALRRGRRGLLEAVAESGLAPQTGLLLVVDQFEEVFRFRREGQGRDDADAFVDLLLASAQADGRPGDAERPVPGANPIQVVLTMRSDYLGDCAVFTGLPEAINDSQFLTPRLTRDQYQDAIREPALLRRAELDPRLVNRLLNDMGEDPNQLPVLQHALMRMWTSAAAKPEWNRVLTLADYPEGGLAAALSTHCDDVYLDLADDEARRLAEVLFRALCERTGTRRDTRRPQTIAALAGVAGVESEPEALYPVIEAFRRPDRSLLTPPVPQPLGPETVVDIGHESLIGHWQRLAAWVDAEEESAREYRRLADAAQLEAAGEGGLLHGQDLRRMLDWQELQQPGAAWADRYGGNYAQAMHFLERSRLEAEAKREWRRLEQAEQEAARQRELQVAQALAEQRSRSARNLRVWLLVSALLVLVAVGAAWWALNRAAAAHLATAAANQSAAVAEVQRKTALESRAKWFMELAGHDKLAAPQRSLLLALEANRAAPHLTATENLIREVLGPIGGRPLIGHMDSVTAVAYSPDGRTLASGASDQTIRLWDSARPGAEPRVLRGHEGAVRAVAYSPDGRTLASGADDKTIRLWDPARPAAALGILRRDGGAVFTVAFSPDGRMLASGSDDGTIGLWDLTRLAAEPRVLRGHEGSVLAVAFSPDGRTLASTAADKTIRLWDPARPAAEPRVLRGHKNSVEAVAFSPDGRTLASGSEDGTIRLWDLTPPAAEPRVLRRYEGAVPAVAFSPDGRTLADGSDDGTIRLWDLTRPAAVPQVLRGHEGAVWAVAYSPDGRTLASGSVDGTVRLWDPPRPEAELRVLRGHAGAVQAVAFSPDGRTLASGSDDGTIRLWDPARAEAEPRVLRGHAGAVLAVAFSPDGGTLAGAAEGGTIRLWDLARPAADPRVLRGHEGGVMAVAFSPDGRTLASGSDDGTVGLWDPARPAAEPRVLRGHEGAVRALAFAPDGRTLAGGSSDSDDGTVCLWDPIRPEAEPRVLRGHEGAVLAVAFSPDGRTLASGSGAGAIRLWDPTPPAAKPRVLRGSEDSWATAVAFSPDGRTLASGSDDDTIRLWDLSRPEAEPRVLRGHGDWVLAVAFSPDGRAIASGSKDQTIRLWDPDIAGVRATACERLARNLSAEDWELYFGNEAPVKTCPGQAIHPSFFETADALAEMGQVDEAIASYREVLARFGSQEFDPLVRARYLAAPNQRKASVALAEKGQVDQALVSYAEAKRWDPGLPDSGEIETSLCRYASLWGRAGDVLSHCERAIELRPDQGGFSDSRGLARAQTGDLAGAIADFRAFIAWAQADAKQQASIARHRQWIESLDHGRNPFDPATLEALRRAELSPESAEPTQAEPPKPTP